MLSHLFAWRSPKLLQSYFYAALVKGIKNNNILKNIITLKQTHALINGFK